MRSDQKSFMPRTILLLSDDETVAHHIESALASFCLTHHIEYHENFHSFHQSLIGSSLQSASTVQVDLILIAYVDDEEKTHETLSDLRLLPRWKLVPSVIFLSREDPSFTRMLYHLGANTVLKYPLRFDALQQLISTMDAYWFNTVTLPDSDEE
ncbi:MAG: hypothetical protein ABJ000_00225 [Saccharospirillum sp.]|uniref:hypothetical protein n=1 Tax=Saccharospirillum sp. TaxID=2033801 RepID=UPI003298D94B